MSGGRSRPPARSQNDAGFTLIEMMIALVLFALISLAGLALVNGVLGVQGRTETRLDRLADLQRTMLVVTSDVEQIAAGDVAGGGDSLRFTRAAPGLGGAPAAVRYALVGDTLVRSVNPSRTVLMLPLPLQPTTVPLVPLTSMMDSPVPRPAGNSAGPAGMPAFAPRMVRLALLIVSGPAYVPGHTSIVSPATAAAIAVWIVV